jgi:REP-associated tyrosine transposase
MAKCADTLDGMPRAARIAPGGYVYHALNRGVARLALFENDDDYQAFEQVLVEALERAPIRLLGYCLSPSHWHFVLWPRKAGELTAFLRWLTLTHTQRWHAQHRSAGSGHLYQGRFKAFPVEGDEHFLTVLRYAESNSLRAGLCERAEDWDYSSFAHRRADAATDPIRQYLCAGPTPLPPDWNRRVNRPQMARDLEAVRRCVQRGQPYGSPAWIEKTTRLLGLQSTFRMRGRPRKIKE